MSGAQSCAGISEGAHGQAADIGRMVVDTSTACFVWHASLFRVSRATHTEYDAVQLITNQHFIGIKDLVRCELYHMLIVPR